MNTTAGRKKAKRRAAVKQLLSFEALGLIKPTVYEGSMPQINRIDQNE
ncbi:hypothetical protein [Halobacillus ihumii]|nr:hypothetical protein [Halobacillus ihumii]